ncbi:hypothetical protein ScPMuIL_000806 [Solemya velum]
MDKSFDSLNFCLKKLTTKARRSHEDARKDYTQIKIALRNGNLAAAEHLVDLLDIDNKEAADYKIASDELSGIVSKLRKASENGEITDRIAVMVKYLSDVIQCKNLSKLKATVNILREVCAHVENTGENVEETIVLEDD